MTKRFDFKENEVNGAKKILQRWQGKTQDNGGANFKYEYSYEEAGRLIQKFVPAWRIEIEKYYSLVVFNFLFSNGDAHLKNFSLLESSSGDYLLSPAYDLLNTNLHVDDTILH
ncbi:MAG: HipA domain-containing protein [Bacteroidetes bacterium]|nr:HipA domain-containing protein [Bacteroidota bacterium]